MILLNQARDEVISPKEAREMLKADNSEIRNLCRKACLIPKKDSEGHTYFSRSDIEVLKKAKLLWDKAKTVEDTITRLPARNSSFSQTAASAPIQAPPIEGASLSALEQNIVNKITKVIDEKMDGIDEVVIELIRAKTENESLRHKLNELNKENYRLKGETQSFKHVFAGFYVKKETDEFIL